MLLLVVRRNGDEWTILIRKAFIQFLPLDIPFCTGIYLNCRLEQATSKASRVSEHFNTTLPYILLDRKVFDASLIICITIV